MCFMSSALNHGSTAAFVAIDSPVTARSIHGDSRHAAAGSGCPLSRNVSSIANAKLAPAESPAKMMSSGINPVEISDR
jgi:hypothetical protein